MKSVMQRIAARASLAGVLAALVVAAPGAAAVSSAVGKPLQSAAAAAKAGNTGAAIKAVDQARAAAKTDEERRKVAEMAAYVYNRAGQYGKAAAELESIGAPPTQLAPLYQMQSVLDRIQKNVLSGPLANGTSSVTTSNSDQKARYNSFHK